MKSNKSVNIIRIPFLAAIALCISATYSLAQTSTSSPYSRYGIGDVNPRGAGQNFGMGGTNIGMQNDTTPMFFINSGNPASYSNMRLTAIELGMNYNRLTLESETQKKTINSAGLGYISLAFPIYLKWWGSSIGLVPYSSVGYNVSDQKEIPNVGTVDYLYEGSGGINQLYWGNGVKPLYGLAGRFARSEKYAQLKKEGKDSTIARIMKRRKTLQGLSVGANISYLFGNFENTRRSIFDQSGNFFNTRTGITTRVSDVYFDYGAQFAFYIDSVRNKDVKGAKRDLKENVKITLGATFSAQSDIQARMDSLSVTYFYNSLGNEIVKDTIQLSQNTSGNISFPLSFGFGASFKKGDRWILGADFSLQNWSSFTSFDQNPGLKNSMRFSLGGQYIPNPTAKSGAGSYLMRVHYRLGARYAQTALELKSTQLTEYAVTAGLGLPVGRNFLLQNFSMVNIGAEYGQRGTVSNGLIKENFVKITLGFTINDRWFQKPKFD
jgi:hypothetical protein